MWYTHTHTYAGRTPTHIKKLIRFKGFNSPKDVRVDSEWLSGLLWKGLRANGLQSLAF